MTVKLESGFFTLSNAFKILEHLFIHSCLLEILGTRHLSYNELFFFIKRLKLTVMI